MVNNLIQVTTRFGAVQCGGPVTLNRLLGGTLDNLTDPRVQFDNINQRFSLVVTISSVTANDTPALWVAATQGDYPCGTWITYRMTFDGDATPAGTFLDFPMFAQDTRSLLLSTRNCLPTKACSRFIVFAIPKASIDAGAHVDFPYFNVDSLTAPVTHAGQPMVETGGVSFFLAAVPDVGYKVYLMVPTPFGPALVSITFPSPFSIPSREARQPGTSVEVDSADGNITWSPYFDGTRIWFTHVVDTETFPTVKYGAINLPDGTVSTAYASHSPWSDDFNPSLAVVLSPRGKPSTSPGPRRTRWWPRPPPPSWPSRWTLPSRSKSLRGVNGLRDRRQFDHRVVRRLLIRLRRPDHERLCLCHPAVLRRGRKLEDADRAAGGLCRSGHQAVAADRGSETSLLFCPKARDRQRGAPIRAISRLSSRRASS